MSARIVPPAGADAGVPAEGAEADVRPQLIVGRRDLTPGRFLDALGAVVPALGLALGWSPGAGAPTPATWWDLGSRGTWLTVPEGNDGRCLAVALAEALEIPLDYHRLSCEGQGFSHLVTRLDPDGSVQQIPHLAPEPSLIEAGRTAWIERGAPAEAVRLMLRAGPRRPREWHTFLLFAPGDPHAAIPDAVDPERLRALVGAARVVVRTPVAADCVELAALDVGDQPRVTLTLPVAKAHLLADLPPPLQRRIVSPGLRAPAGLR